MAKLLSAFINWGLLMSLLVNIVNYSDPKNRPTSALWLCIIICISYLSTSFGTRDLSKYLIWVAADIVTIIVILLALRRRQRTPAFYYSLVVLALNALMHLSIYIDVVIAENYEPWWLWSIYTIGINVNDVIMIFALAINKDVLGLCWSGRYIKRLVDTTSQVKNS